MRLGNILKSDALLGDFSRETHTKRDFFAKIFTQRHKEGRGKREEGFFGKNFTQRHEEHKEHEEGLGVLYVSFL
jgi:hypothetical protein